MKKYGIIQLRGAGDVIIGLPIAKYIYNMGHEVYWVIDEHFHESFSSVAPYVNWIPLKPEGQIHGNIFNEFWHEAPTRILRRIGCEEIISFPYEETRYRDKIQLNRFDNSFAKKALELDLSSFLTFDQFKYAVAGVPFKEKWNLDLRRNYERENSLYEKVVDPSTGTNYIVLHEEGAMGTFKCQINDMGFFKQNFGEDVKIVRIRPESNNIFDWITTIEKSAGFIGVDSFFANLIEQMELPIRKIFIRRSPVFFTPILRNQWEYLKLNFGVANELSYTKQ